MAKKINVGDTVQLIYNCQVVGHADGHLQVIDKERGLTFDIRGNSLIDSLNNADYYERSEELTKTEIAQKLTETHGQIFTVKFTKQGGQDRLLKGYLAKIEPLLGRCYCVDLYAEGATKLRLVDNRTISELIFNGIRYFTK